MPIYNLMEYSDSKTSEILCQYCGDGQLYRSAGQTNAAGIKDLKIMVPLKYLSIFSRTIEMLLIICEINLVLTWSENCVISTVTNQAIRFPITITKCYVLVVTLSTQVITKLLQQFKSSFKRTINWNKYLSKLTMQR